MGGGLPAYGFHFHLHCLHPGRLGVGLGGWGVDSIRLPLPFALSTPWKTASVHTLHMPKPNVTRVQSATEWTASVHTLHMSKPNVTRVQSATEWTASVHTLHMPKSNGTRHYGVT